jgi:hypothetical protein
MLTKKLEQALTLEAFVAKHPAGRNYDFGWAADMAAFVVSPFIEWIWSDSPKLWHSGNLPRILSADEVLSFLISESATTVR